MAGPMARGSGVIDRQTFRIYEKTANGSAVVGGVLALHSTNGFPYDLTLDIFREYIEEGRTIVLQPYDLIYEMCALCLYDQGEEIGQAIYKEAWPEVYEKAKFWGAYHWTVAKNTTTAAGKPFDSELVWGMMLISMREELRGYLKTWKTRGKELYERTSGQPVKWDELDEQAKDTWRIIQGMVETDEHLLRTAASAQVNLPSGPDTAQS
jgi:hypothetical protein